LVIKHGICNITTCIQD